MVVTMEPTLQFMEFLKACITPVALISGVGLILLTVTNRIGRVIDRIRMLVNEIDRDEVKRRHQKVREIRILFQRGRYLRSSIALIMVSVIASCLMIPVLFVMMLLNFDLKLLGYSLFILSTLAILVSAIFFFMDVLLGLKALHLEADEHLEE